MALFQTSVLKTYLAQQDNSVVERAYKKYTKYFHNATIQENIKNSKEEQYQAKFLDELFVNILGYTLNPKPNFNITTEFKNQKGAGKADGAILKETKAIGVIELKGTNTKDLESIRKQAFDYKANQKGCVYVITSNFEKLRFYINDATEFLEFNLFQLAPEEFALMYLCLQKDNILNNLPLTIKEASLVEEDKITKQFYNDYSVFKRELFRDLVKRNAKRLKQNVIASEARQSHNGDDSTELKALEKNVKLSLFKKSQKLIDRFLFIFFAEDRDLLPPNSTIQILDKWKADIDFGDERPLYNLFKQYFHFLDEGRKGTTSRAEIYAYNGGLFKPDAILDSLEIDDDLLYKHTYKLAKYDFSSQVDVNILGHIFENSLNEIESVNAEIEGGEFDKQKSKRKKDGVFYTPKYITKYIVENTIGKLCQEKKESLGFKEEAYFEIKKGTHQNTKKQLLEVLDNYRAWLLQITICDPACGSGAFLNQALDFLIKEHRYIDELKAKVLGGGLILSDIENTILENNIYGVDLNEESVEIAKLSLWLRTAQPRRKLNDLSNNIKCGNSLIDSKTVAGDKAFNWQQEFPQIFDKGGFDVIIGNPPWGAKFPELDLKFVKSKHQAIIVRMIDSFMFFMDKSIDLITKDGVIGMIVPDVILYQKDNSKLRERILDETHLNIALNVGDGIFEDVARPSAILIYEKTESIEPIIVGNFNKYKDDDITVIKTYEVEKDLFYSIPNTVIATQNLKGYELLKRYKKSTLKDYIDDDGIQRGVSPDLKDAFIVTQEIIKERKLEIDFIKKTVTGGVDVKRYYTIDSDKYLFYLTKEDNPSDFPNIYKYIEEYLPRITCKEVKLGKHPFYTLHRARNKNIFEKESKVLGVITGDSIITSIDEEKIYPTDGLYLFNSNSKISNKYLSAFLNSKISTYLYRLLSSETGRTLAQVKPVLLSQLPFVEPDEQTVSEVENVYDKISKEIKEFVFIKTKFITYLLHQYNELVVTRKLDNWHELDFADFIKELNKAIKKASGTPLTKKDEFEWLELFEDNKKKAQELQTQITQTEKTIDTMVYDLYSLTQEEREIVENS
ncbi:Eco57I restriction-modification methylase domain-containing protein [Olleya aquimaris]|uniref:site-specific DNA-methyltransferase (adenine-specific) n=1 Tax=Olleya aquimaris TaxID=639310 RepID=A0A327R818_9FLAO|nr:N-6 DNA methylase [Olleya aquimaris]RAJ11824.1 TaqI restriction endonuclease [Olleya aquimaris]